MGGHPAAMSGRARVRPSQYWVDALRVAHRINDPQDMTDAYLYALIEFLSNHAEHMLSGYRRMQPTAALEPREWLESTSLMRGLRK
ncbi:hypothetical protein [Mycolicibacterium tusciae]|uniref:hypothetical protein n=1 Tax=Mycolicibacterium tusciae TaxID=75922 RepID=UPI001056B9B7|nr:hypothetical protein [Mycolicibacterium tusciae]